MSFARPSAVKAPALRWAKLGDLGLCLFFAMVAVAHLTKTYDAASKGDLLLACHFAMSGGATAVMAAFLLMRGQAISKATQWDQKIVAIIGTFAIVPLGLLPTTWDADWMLELTSGGFILAYGWIAWSLFTLKRCISVFPEARTLVTRGPYGLVRHPLYAAYFLTYTLLMLPRFSLLAVVLTIVGIAAEVTRSRYEEGVLRAAFPEYDAYAQRVRAFVPIKRRTDVNRPTR